MSDNSSQYVSFVNAHRAEFRFRILSYPSLFIIDLLGLMYKFPYQLAIVQQKLIKLHRSRKDISHVKVLVSDMVSSFLITLLLLIGLLFVTADLWTILCAAIPLMLLIPSLIIINLNKKLKLRAWNISYELPEFINKLMLLVNAGETVQRAIVRCVEQRSPDDSSSLYVELEYLIHNLQHNYAFSRALDEFNRRCGVLEVSIFATTLMLNHRRGGDQLVVVLRELSRELWEKRKAMSRTLGEEASSKLIFPMMLIFLDMMFIVAAPAVMLMNE